MSLLQMSVDLVCEGFDCVVWGCRVCFHCSQLPHAWCLMHAYLTGRCHILSNTGHSHKDYLMKQTHIRRHIAVVTQALITLSYMTFSMNLHEPNFVFYKSWRELRVDNHSGAFFHAVINQLERRDHSCNRSSDLTSSQQSADPGGISMGPSRVNMPHYACFFGRMVRGGQIFWKSTQLDAAKWSKDQLLCMLS